MTELAAQKESGLDGSQGLRGAMADAAWPLRKAAWKVEEKVIWGGTDAARGTLDAAKWPFEGIGWAVERRILWPLQDLFRSRSAPGRTALAVVLAAAAVVAAGGGAMLARDSGSATPVANPNRGLASVTSTTPRPVHTAPAETLEGATPNFKSSPTEGESSSDEAASASSAGTASADVAPAVDAKPSAIPAAPGEQTGALKAAHRFAAAFVLYEIGEQRAKVRRTFALTATPALVKALRERPPRLPSEVDVPKARVLNVILGEPQRQQVDASVSLLRLGDVSELRLTLTKDDDGWAVSEVRG